MTDGADNGEQTTLTPRSVGERLRAAREAQGMSLAEIAARTRVPQRHLEAIEDGSYESLPSPTYAMGFVRAYARTVGEDEVTLAHDTREEVSRLGRPVAQYQPYEIADPARVPSRGLVIVAAGVALAIVVLAVLWFAVGMWRSHADNAAASAPAVVAPVPTATPAAPQTPAGGHVSLTASDDVWLRVYDADDKTLFIGTMKKGDKFDVPADAKEPKINVGRPDKLTVTLNGSALPPLGDGSRPIKNVAVSAEALAARISGTTPNAARAAPAAAPTASPRTGGTRPPAFVDPASAAAPSAGATDATPPGGTPN